MKRQNLFPTVQPSHKKVKFDKIDLPNNWIDRVFADYPNWDAEEKAPLEVYSVYHTIQMLSKESEMSRDGVYQDFMAHKANSFGYLSHQEMIEFLSHLPPLQWNNFTNIRSLIETFYTREALMCIGI